MTNSLEDEVRAWPAASSSDFSEELLWELWKQIVEGLRKEDSKRLSSGSTPSYSAALRAAESNLGIVDFSAVALIQPPSFVDPESATAGSPYDVVHVGRPLRPTIDYIRGAALAINPFPSSEGPYTYDSDFAAMASDWDCVRDDIMEAWGQMMEQDPLLAQAVLAKVGERANGGRRGANRTDRRAQRER